MNRDRDVKTISKPDLERLGVRITRQGVRSLDGPRMNGTGHNGRTASCAHFRAPDAVSTYAKPTIELNENGAAVTKFATFCSACDAKIYDDSES